MKTAYHVRVYQGDPGREHLIAENTRAASSVHYAVREVLHGYRASLPRGWRNLTITVSRP